MPPQQLSLPRGSLVLVTGANGYIGSQVIKSLLDLGYLVRGTVRAPKPWLNQYFNERYGIGKFESIIVQQLDDLEAIKIAMKGVQGVVHVATEMSFNPDPNSVITPMKAAIENILTIAATEKSVKRVVYTSSAAAVIFPKVNEEVIIDENSWNDFTVKAAWDPNTPEELRGVIVYCASKVEAERAAWKFIEEKKPKFVFNSVVPNINFGRVLHPEIAGSSMGGARALLEGDASITKLLIPQWFVDVEDNARIHAIALLDPSVVSERIFAFAATYRWTEIVQIIRRLRPANASLPAIPENEGYDLSKILPAKRAEQLLQNFYGKGWTTLEESIKAGIEDLE